MIRYAYLWRSEFEAGREEGTKDRPCAVVLSLQKGSDRPVVIVLAITHAPPHEPDAAMELPAETKRRLGLDGQRSWVVIAEFNRFAWPGPDLRPQRNGEPASILYGLLPSSFFNELKKAFVARARARKVSSVTRSE